MPDPCVKKHDACPLVRALQYISAFTPKTPYRVRPICKPLFDIIETTSDQSHTHIYIYICLSRRRLAATKRVIKTDDYMLAMNIWKKSNLNSLLFQHNNMPDLCDCHHSHITVHTHAHTFTYDIVFKTLSSLYWQLHSSMISFVYSFSDVHRKWAHM